MNICKKCKNIMKPLKKGTYQCVYCGLISQDKDLIEIEIEHQPEKKGKGVVKDKNIFADYPFICKKCGYKKAEIIERQPYVSDEDSLTYLKCGKCGWTENLAKKIS